MWCLQRYIINKIRHVQRSVRKSIFKKDNIIAFDAFGKFPKQQDSRDSSFIAKFEKAGGDGIPIDDMRNVLQYKSFRNVELIPGDILVTVQRYVQEHPALKIAFLHIDVDVYQPSVVILNHLYDKVVKGRLVVFDDFGTVAGETRAIDEFFAGQDLAVRKLPISHIPAYIRK